MDYRRAVPALLLATACFSDPPSGTSGGADTTGDSSESSGAQSTGLPGTGGSTMAVGSTGPDETTGGGIEPPTTGVVDSSSSTGIRPGETTDEPPPLMCPPGVTVLYLAFDGATLVNSGVGIDNAPDWLVADPNLAGDYGAYTPDDRAEVAGLVHGHFEPFGICVTDQPPMALDYDLIVVTSDTFDDNPNALGFARVDCDNAVNNNVGVVFLSDMIEIGTARRAIAISKFAAALYGLEGLSDPPAPQEIMNRFVSSTNNGAEFTDDCLPVADPVCTPVDCEDGMQSSSARLIAAQQ